jgi:hypothetical protein
MTGRIIFPSAGRSGDFLQWAWHRRDTMSPGERQGLAQAIYASLLGHIEATASEVLDTEYQRTLSVLSQRSRSESPEHVLRATGVSIAIVLEKQAALERLTFEPLLRELELVFPKYRDGPKRHADDLLAVRNLRNTFVHGRSISLPLSVQTGTRIDTDGTTMKHALDRLITANVVTRADTLTQGDLMGGDEARLFSMLHADAAVLHFTGIGRRFQTELLDMVGLDSMTRQMLMFPDLGSSAAGRPSAA